jgi:MFS family permease
MTSDAVPIKKRKGMFPGWSIVVAGSTLAFWGYSILTYSFGVYVNALTAEFGWTREQLSLAYSFRSFEGGLAGPFAGPAIDKWGPRAISIVGFVAFGIGQILLYYVNSLWLFYVLWILVAAGGNLGLNSCFNKAAATWFVKRRGFVLGIISAFQSLGAPVLVPLVTWLLYTYGWRESFLISGTVTLVVGIPLIWFFFKPKRPEYYGWLPDGKRVGEKEAVNTEVVIQKGVEYAAEMQEVEFTARQALKTRAFWILTIVSSLGGIASPVFFVHLIPFLTDKGISPMAAASMMGVEVFFAAPSRFFFGWLSDLISIKRIKYLFVLGAFIEAAGVLILIFAGNNMTWLWAFMVIEGLGFGARSGITGPLRGRYWGRKAFASIQGFLTPFTMLAGTIAPVYAGWVFDTTGSYQVAFVAVFACMALGVIGTFFLNPPKPPKKITKVTEFF